MDFVRELSRAEREVENLDTFFGRLWNLISPLLSALIYYVFIYIVQGGHQGTPFFLHLVLGVFIFEFIMVAVMRGSTSIVGASGLINNTAFPKVLMPIGSTWTAFQLLIPALSIYIIFHLALRQPITLAGLQFIPGLILLTLFTAGLTMFAATAQVYFRDTNALAPFILRMLMFAAPVMYFPEQAKEVLGGKFIALLNPLFCLIQIVSGSAVRGDTFDAWTWIIASCWSIGMLLVGFSFLVTREGEFAARI